MHIGLQQPSRLSSHTHLHHTSPTSRYLQNAQVQHFDRLHDKEQALILALHRNINATSKEAAGALGGKAQE